ncbi:ThuA domain-containing protein [Rubritalea marina]|uniref:ThuA domain-containing protein n=1 Tax=Rubritalea marina TaxID=361055 RepID=UPI0003A159E6|nr:ThuA domain-containing protein [Rubritalea marina]
MKQGVLAGAAFGIAGLSSPASAKDSAPKKIKALLVTGGGHHDYEAQKKILTEGVSELIDVEWTIWHDEKSVDTKKALSAKGWADPYDIVVYNICHAHENDEAYINSVVNVHKAGKPMVAIHCSMHSYHWNVGGGRESKQDKEWNKLLGVRSMNHGPVGPAITAKKTEVDHPAYRPANKEWKTPKGELYNIHQIYPSATVLAEGNNGHADGQPVVWVNEYGKAKVFGTTIGHHNETVQTKEYLQVIANGMLWAVSAT